MDWNAIILAFINGPGTSLAFMFLGVLALIFGLAAIRYARISDQEGRKETARENRIRVVEQRLAKVLEQKALSGTTIEES
jgi:hypothetical protein